MAEDAMQTAMDRLSAAAYQACAAAVAECSDTVISASVHQPKHIRLQNGAAVTQLYAHMSGPVGMFKSLCRTLNNSAMLPLHGIPRAAAVGQQQTAVVGEPSVQFATPMRLSGIQDSLRPEALATAINAANNLPVHVEDVRRFPHPGSIRTAAGEPVPAANSYLLIGTADRRKLGGGSAQVVLQHFGVQYKQIQPREAYLSVLPLDQPVAWDPLAPAPTPRPPPPATTSTGTTAARNATEEPAAAATRAAAAAVSAVWTATGRFGQSSSMPSPDPASHSNVMPVGPLPVTVTVVARLEETRANQDISSGCHNLQHGSSEPKPCNSPTGPQNVPLQTCIRYPMNNTRTA
eukprot:GHUV01032835.1.p1 GENE.GHUV01032835.1~~GHUV01032835.1.p1  ORF type:complete len:348 (-),score=100.08 GHUV01032835.1:336-1379(-)